MTDYRLAREDVTDALAFATTVIPQIAPMLPGNPEQIAAVLEKLYEKTADGTIQKVAITIEGNGIRETLNLEICDNAENGE